LQNNIKFNNLALVIIDEEQHFGVAQKEKLKKLRNNVHILNLSATPIPRTLQMSLTGVKDLSLIATPPLDRLSVRNFVMPFDNIITKEAIMREYNRGGKIFFVVPRVKDLHEIMPKLQKLLPDLKIACAHGQMPVNELDDIMNEFSDSDTDILISTTIIESGIDISIANTMIIYKAEMFGLSQLYQLRGRVGRSKLRGYCYFMTDRGKKIKDSAKKKLEVMQNLDSLGVGFNIASHDMDIRGSGNLLGDEQSGHIKETGVELYQQMLLETIDKLKNSSEINSNQEIITSEIDHSIQIKLSISLLIPKDYIEDLSLRMSFYKKIALIKNNDDQEALCNEMNDRFGKIPQEVNNLMEIAKIKHQCYLINITSITTGQNTILIAFKDNKFRNPDKLLKLVFSSNNKIKINPDQKLVFHCQLINDQAKINKVYEILKIIQQL
jgi:transcription-repair coupling factor (superfamily II helicase)